MAKGKRNSQKKKNNSKGNEEIDNENDDEDVKKCPHISRSVKLHNLQNKIPHTTLGQCLDCGELDSSEELGVCICLCCAQQGCDRNSEEKHSLSHNKSTPNHNIVVHLQNWVVWCYACDDEVPVEPESALHNCIKLMLKAMKLSPPPELELSLSSPTKVSNDKPKKDGLKNSSQLKSQIKGLSNLGNTCFFNAVMQNLCQTELLHVAASCSAQEGFSQHVSPKTKDLPQLTVTVQEGPGSVTKALWKLLQDFRSSASGTLNPRQLFGEICKTATRFKGFRQQDSQELLRYLLDSIRNEEIRRVKVAVLKSFGVTGGDNAKSLDDNKKGQVKEYGASAEAPLIDSVFAGRLVSIVICRQCHKEFKVEETFLDLSLPLSAPHQESWNNKIFGKGGKQNPKSPKSANNKDESTIIKDDATDTGTDSKAKSPSKHQLKSARKAERKKGKKGRGHGKTGKGKTTEQAIDNKRADNDGEDKDNGESGDEGGELNQMNVSDLDGNDNEQEHKLNDDNNATEALVNDNGEPTEKSNNVPQGQHEKSKSKGDDEDPPLGGVKLAGADMPKPTGDGSQEAGKNNKMETEPVVYENNPIKSTVCLDKRINEKHVESCKGNDQECEQNTLDVENEVSSMDMSDNGNKEEIDKQDPSATIFVKQLSPANTSDSKMELEDQHFHDEQAEVVSGDVLSNANEMVEGIRNLTLNTSLEKDDGDFQTESDSSNVNAAVSCALNRIDDAVSPLSCTESPSKGSAIRDEGKDRCIIKGDTLNLAESLPRPGGHSETETDRTIQDEGKDRCIIKGDTLNLAESLPGGHSETETDRTIQDEGKDRCIIKGDTLDPAEIIPGGHSETETDRTIQDEGKDRCKIKGETLDLAEILPGGHSETETDRTIEDEGRDTPDSAEILPGGHSETETNRTIQDEGKDRCIIKGETLDLAEILPGGHSETETDRTIQDEGRDTHDSAEIIPGGHSETETDRTIQDEGKDRCVIKGDTFDSAEIIPGGHSETETDRTIQDEGRDTHDSAEIIPGGHSETETDTHDSAEILPGGHSETETDRTIQDEGKDRCVIKGDTFDSAEIIPGGHSETETDRTIQDEGRDTHDSAEILPGGHSETETDRTIQDEGRDTHDSAEILPGGHSETETDRTIQDEGKDTHDSAEILPGGHSETETDRTIQDEGKDRCVIKGDTFDSAESLTGGNSKTGTTSISEETSSTSLATNNSSNEAEGDTTETQTNECVSEPVKNNQDCVQEIEIGANENISSDSAERKETKEAEEITSKSENECDTDYEEEREHDSGANRTLTLQPSYHPSHGECSVMSCLNQFCASEVLDGNNKFACEECSKRAQRLNKDKESTRAGKERIDDDKDDVSDDDECKGAKAAKNKKTKHGTVYTVATKQLLISLAPPVLTLHLKRFQQTRFTLHKLTKHVDFPLELNLAPFCSRSGKNRTDSEGQVLYSLYGIVQHSGNMNSGHYTAYVKVREPPVKGLYDRITNMNELTDFIGNMWTGKTQAKHRNSRYRHEPAADGQWFHVSDSSVCAVPETKVLKSQAYMLFYGRLPLGST